MENAQLHNNIKVSRTKSNWTQAELADWVGVTRQTIAFIEKGNYAPSVALALKLAEALREPVTELFWLEEKEDESNV